VIFFDNDRKFASQPFFFQSTVYVNCDLINTSMRNFHIAKTHVYVCVFARQCVCTSASAVQCRVHRVKTCTTNDILSIMIEIFDFYRFFTILTSVIDNFDKISIFIVSKFQTSTQKCSVFSPVQTQFRYIFFEIANYRKLSFHRLPFSLHFLTFCFYFIYRTISSFTGLTSLLLSLCSSVQIEKCCFVNMTHQSTRRRVPSPAQQSNCNQLVSDWYEQGR
jgi:hypothetical protein